MNHVVKAFLSGWFSSRLFSTLYHSTQDSGSGREGDCGPAWVTCPCLGREEEGFSNWVQARLHAAKEEKSPTGKIRGWGGWNNRSPLQQRKVSCALTNVLPCHITVSGFCLLTHSSHRALWSWGWATENTIFLSPHTRTTSSFDSLHTSLLSYPPEHDIYGNLFHCFVLAATPSRPISFKLSSASAAMNIKTQPSVRKRKKFYPLSLSSLQKESPHCSPDIIGWLFANPLPTSVFPRMLSSTNQRRRKSADKLCNWNRRANKNGSESTQKPIYNDTL